MIRGTGAFSVYKTALVLVVAVTLAFPVSTRAATSSIDANLLSALAGILRTFSQMLAAMPQQQAAVPAGNQLMTVSAFAPAQRIDNLSNVTISHATISGVTGLTSSDIPDLSGKYLSLNGGAISGSLTLTNATSTNLAVSGTASTSALVASNSFTLGNLTGFLKATAGAVATSLINLAIDVTGILPVGNGGTGWSAIAAGAIPYGNGSSALATTSAGTAGQVLALLNGVPTWTATTTLSTISGTLPVGQGGTGWANINSGSILFGNAASALATSSNLFWDNTNSRLGIGTTTPQNTLYVSGSIGATTVSTSRASSLASKFQSVRSSGLATNPVNPTTAITTSTSGPGSGYTTVGPWAASFTGNTTAGSNVITSVSSTAGVIVGQPIVEDGSYNAQPLAVDLGVTVTTVGTNTITVSAPALTSRAGLSFHTQSLSVGLVGGFPFRYNSENYTAAASLIWNGYSSPSYAIEFMTDAANISTTSPGIVVALYPNGAGGQFRIAVDDTYQSTGPLTGNPSRACRQLSQHSAETRWNAARKFLAVLS